MKALSIKQPWADLIIHGYKSIENRTWKPSHYLIGQRILIHTSKAIDTDFDITTLPVSGLDDVCWNAIHKRRLGVIIGSARLVRCVTHSTDPWFQGPYGFVFQDVKEFDELLPVRGSLGFFDVKYKEA